MRRKYSGLPLTLVAIMLTLMLAACGDPTATTIPATTAPAKPTTAATTVAATTSAATTVAATTVATTSAATTVPTTAAITTATTAPTTSVATTAATAAKAGATTYPLTITDDAKRSIKFEKAPSKIVSLAPSNTELLYALGLGERVVGVDEYSDFPAEAKQKEKIGGYKDTNLERVIALNTDLVLASGITAKQLISTMETRGLMVVVLDPTNLAGVVANMKLVAQLTNVPEKGEALATEFQKKLDEVTAKTKDVKARPRIFYELDPTLFTVGPGSFIDEMIQKAGGQNIVTDTTNPYPQLNQEVVINKDPEVILLGDDTGGNHTPEKILTRPGWDKISAIKNKRVYALNANLVNRPGPRAALGVENIAKALYPDLFK